MAEFINEWEWEHDVTGELRVSNPELR
jgi:hypothetical protein